MKAFLFTIAALVAIHCQQVLGHAMCFYPDGSTAVDDIPCNNSTANSGCCGTGSSCMSSGLCFESGVISRGSCTDAQWKSGDCPQYCQDCNPTGGCPLTPSKWTNEIPNLTTLQWCCNLPNTTGGCYDGNTIEIVAGNILPTATATASGSAMADATGSSSASSSSAAMLLAGESMMMQRTCQKQEAAIGAGVGVPLMLLAALFGVLFLRERQRGLGAKRLMQQTQQIPAPGYGYTPPRAHIPDHKYMAESPGNPVMISELDTERPASELEYLKS